jgi:hypothetical protein
MSYVACPHAGSLRLCWPAQSAHPSSAIIPVRVVWWLSDDPRRHKSPSNATRRCESKACAPLTATERSPMPALCVSSRRFGIHSSCSTGIASASAEALANAPLPALQGSRPAPSGSSPRTPPATCRRTRPTATAELSACSPHTGSTTLAQSVRSSTRSSSSSISTCLRVSISRKHSSKQCSFLSPTRPMAMTCSQGLRINGNLRIALAYSCKRVQKPKSGTCCHTAWITSTESPLLP